MKLEERWLHLREFTVFLLKNLVQDRILLSAGSLAFQTVLSLVPLMAVTLSILSISPFFDTFQQYVDDFILMNFMPASGEVIREYLWQFIRKTSTVPTLGGIFLFIIALFLISTIDTTINHIWGVDAPRKFFQAFTLYWTVLTLGPVFIGSSLVATSYVWYTFFTEGFMADLQARLLMMLPVLNSFLGFLLLYILVPNKRVRFVHAISGAMLASLLFELSKKWFSFYVSTFATFEHIYGALAVIPLLFFWIYLIWVVVLTGAEFVYSLGAVRQSPVSQEGFHPLRGMNAILAVIEAIARAQYQGSRIDMKRLSREVPGLGSIHLGAIARLMEEQDIIHKTEGGTFAISCDLHTLSLYELYEKVPPQQLFEAENGREELPPGRLGTMEEDITGYMRQAMQEPVVAFINTPGTQA